MNTPRILIVDDDSSIRTLLSVVAARAGVEADVASDGIEAMLKLDADAYDLVVLDLSMPRMNGYDLIGRLRGRRPRPAVIVLTALPSKNCLDPDPEVVHCVVSKPFDLNTFMALFVATATEMCEARRQGNVIEFPQPNAGC
jgi:DNA-binding response OmpR family regulator